MKIFELQAHWWKLLSHVQDQTANHHPELEKFVQMPSFIIMIIK